MPQQLTRLLGSAPIHPVLFVIAKLSLVLIVVVPMVQVAGVSIARSTDRLTPIAAGLVVVALLLVAVAGKVLAGSVRMGLPAEETELKTGGIYRISRHPMYLAMYLLALAASLYCPHPVVLVSTLLVVVLHHRIALAEEAFLETRFGPAWLAYKGRTPRYVGLPRA